MANSEGKSEYAGLDRLLGWIKRKVPYFWSNWISAAGSMLAVVSVLLLIVMLALYVYKAFLQRQSNPYVDLIGFMVLPAILGAGVVLVVVGNIFRRIQRRRGVPDAHAIEIGGMFLLRKAVIAGGITLILLIGVGVFSYEAYHFTDSNEFCLNVCHQVMAPEGTTYSRSPHAHVPCVSCHIGPGASWFVQAKLSGIRQVFAVLSNSYHQPIPTPVENLRPARETCEVCHWPTKFHGAKLVVKQHFEPDRDNTPTYTANVLKVGGLPQPGGSATGIHWHVDPRNQVRYRHLDAERHDIVEVIQNMPDGEIRYLREDADPDDDSGQWRVMDCIDCHNRPTHIYEQPETAVDEAMASRQLDPAIPYLRRESVRVLREVQPGENTADLIAERLREIYHEDHADDLAALEGQLATITPVLTDILERNVFPQMAIDWHTYPSNLGHFDEEGELAETGCFRCHDDEHVSADGATISQDCENCHAVLAWREEDWEGIHGVSSEFLTHR